MLLVKTYLGVSKIEGLGLYAAERIAKDMVIWRFSADIDLQLTEAQIELLASPCQEQIRKYAYRHKYSGRYILCGDDARFINHFTPPNCTDMIFPNRPDVTIALRDIEIGEELTCDYSLFDQDLIDKKYEI